MLGKDVSDVRLTELGAPRNENSGTAGFGSALAAAKTLGGSLDAQQKAKAAQAQGELVHDFLGQRVEASLETEGFKDLDDRAKDEITRGVGEFDRYLDQVVDSKGGNAFTKAEILRTRKAMAEIAANPANAEAVIKAAGLADKVAGPLAQKLKEEEAAKREIKATAAEYRRKQALENGLVVPQDILLDDEAILQYAEADQGFALLRQTDQLEARALNNAGKRDANELERTAGINVAIPKISQNLINAALQSGQGGANAAQTVLAIEQSAQAQIAELGAAYPYATQRELSHIQSMISDSKNKAIAYAKGEIKGDVLDLYMRNLNIRSKKISLARAEIGLNIESKYSEAQAAADLQFTQSQLAGKTLQLAENFVDMRTSTDPWIRSFWDENPGTADKVGSQIGLLVEGTTGEITKNLLEFGSPDVRAKAATQTLVTALSTGDLNQVPPEAVEEVVSFLKTDLPRFKQQDPEGHRKMLDGLIRHIGTSPDVAAFVKQNPQLMAPLADPAAAELTQSLQDAIFKIGRDSQSAFQGSAVFNPAGSKNLSMLFSETVLSGISILPNTVVKALTEEGSSAHTAADNAIAERVAGLQSALEVLGNNPTEQTFYSNIGHFMQLDESAASKGVLQFKMSDDVADLVTDRNFKASLNTMIRNINNEHSPDLSAKLGALNLLRSNSNPILGYEEVIFAGGNLDLSTFVPQNTIIGTPLEGTN